MVSKEESVVALDAVDAANLVRFRWLEHHNRLLAINGLQGFSTYPSEARFRLGGWRLGEVRHAAAIPVGIAGKEGRFTASALDADIRVLMRKGAMGALGGQSDSSRDSSVLLKRAARNRLGRYPERGRLWRGRVEANAIPCGFGIFF